MVGRVVARKVAILHQFADEVKNYFLECERG